MKTISQFAFKVIALSLMFLAITPVFSHGMEREEISVYKDSKLIVGEDILSENLTIGLSNNNVIVPMRMIFQTLGGEVLWDSGTRIAKGIYKDIVVEAKLGSYFINTGDNVILLPAKTKLVEGTTMVSENLVELIFNVKVDYDKDRNIISIILNDSVNKSDVNNKDTISYEKAVDMAKSNSITLKNAKISVTKAEKLKNEATKNLSNVPIGQGTSSGDAIIRNNFLSVIQATTSWEMAKKNVEILEDNLEYQVKNLYVDVTKKRNSLELQNMVVDNTEKTLVIINKKHEKGLESEYNLNKARYSLQKEQEKKNVLEKDLQNAYLKIKQYIGSNENQFFQLGNNTEVNWLSDDFDLEEHIQKTIQENPYIWLKDQEVKLAEMNLTLYTFNVNDLPYEAKEIDLKLTENNRENLIKSTEESIQELYFQMDQLKNQYELLKLEYQESNNAINVLSIRYDLGMITSAEIDSAQVGVETLRNQMENILVSYEQMKTLLTRPWLQGESSNSQL